MYSSKTFYWEHTAKGLIIVGAQGSEGYNEHKL